MSADLQRIPVQISQGNVVAVIQMELTQDRLEMLQSDMLNAVKTSKGSGVILDVSAMEVLDLNEFDGLRRTMTMARVMGARPLLCGLQPAIITSLIDLGADVDDVTAAINLDAAVALLASFGGDGSGSEESTPEGELDEGTHSDDDDIQRDADTSGAGRSTELAQSRGSSS
jgi:rsbT antagonist protein RsbS